ncbi:hypothetical protein QSV36_15800 [Pseudomonas sp. BCRC 81390]|jgi:hypothetical protein|uniref:hypothetical protein n=1 Tax=Pseudomonas sp. BCRC 81390 TaxID=3054778 RepID=UPI00259A8ABE|nr:hypothetical protein [Pseudomonas sp. BCRC 81390]MDM3887037.1 hypothetical protein [Pseudomonas sp. BCRC 81390]
MVWSSNDNKKYRGKIDRIFVSLTESWEVEYFIDHYLKTRNCTLSDDNRSKVAHKLEGVPGRAPHKREDVNAWLDKEWNLKAV